jgi:ribonuclease P protein component
MLKLENRLKKVRDFNLLIKQGRWINGQFVDLKLLDLQSIAKKALPKRVVEDVFRHQLKVAFSVGVKIDKRAVVRNRLRRQLREVVRLLIKENKIKIGYYLLFVVKSGIKEKEYSAIVQEVQSLLKKARILIV